MRIATLALLATVLVSGSVEQGRRQEFVRQLGAENAGEYQLCIYTGCFQASQLFCGSSPFPVSRISRRVVPHANYTDRVSCLIFTAPNAYVRNSNFRFAKLQLVMPRPKPARLHAMPHWSKPTDHCSRMPFVPITIRC